MTYLYRVVLAATKQLAHNRATQISQHHGSDAGGKCKDKGSAQVLRNTNAVILPHLAGGILPPARGIENLRIDAFVHRERCKSKIQDLIPSLRIHTMSIHHFDDFSNKSVLL